MSDAIESLLEEVTISTQPINPGLFHLSLNLIFQPDTESLNERKQSLNVSLRDEHPTTHLVIQNLIAMINHRLPRRQNEVRKILESILTKHPHHLNTLANLEIVYKELHRQKDADHCKVLKEKLIQTEEPKCIELQAQCLLEQGYALIFEETTNHEGIANQKLKDSLKILLTEHEKSSGERKDQLGRALRHTEQACSFVLNSMYCDRPDEGIQRKFSSIEKFKQGLKLLKSINKENTIEYKIWRYYTGMAYNRFDYSMSKQEDVSEETQSRTNNLGTVLQIFWDTISELRPTHATRLYIGRSYAYIGHLIISRKDMLQEFLNLCRPACFKDFRFRQLIDYPFLCFEKATKIHPSDTHILNRYGRSLRNMSLHISEFENPKEKWDLLWDSYNCLTESISIMPQNNWFAYVNRMQTSRDLGFLDKKNQKDWSMEARMDGIKCFQSKATQQDLCILAKICQMLAKFPNINRYGQTFVKNKEYIHEAINYLNYSLQLGGFASWHTVYNLGTCLYEIGEHRAAIECMKRAIYLSKKSSFSSCITRLGEYIFDLYQAKVSQGNQDYLFDELFFVMRLGTSKYSDIEGSINILCKHQHEMMITFLQYLLTCSKLSDSFGREFVDSCLCHLKTTNRHPDKMMNIDRMREQLETLPPPNLDVVVDLPRGSTYTRPDVIMPFSVDGKTQQGSYKYDFFISHSNVNKDWVNNFLLHQLETKLHDDDIAFKGCIADRDFTPGETIIKNILNAVSESYKIILVITPDFIKSRWCDFEVDHALVDMLSNKKDNCILPILLEGECPKKISHITHLDLTKTTDHSQEIMKLKRTLISED